MNTNKNIRMISLILSIITAIAVFVGLYINVFGGRDEDVKSFKSLGEIETGQVAITGDVKSLSVNLDAAELTIEYGDTPMVEYTMPEKLVPSIDYSNGALVLKNEVNTNISMGSLKELNEISKNIKLTIILPRGAKLDDFNLDIDFGDVHVNGIEARDYNVDCDMGNIEIDGLISKDLSIDAAMGNIEIDNLSCHEVIISADMGNVELRNAIFDEGQFDCDMGNIEVEGDFKKVTADCDMGNIDLNSKTDYKDMDLELDVDLGEITVNNMKLNKH